MKDILVTTDRLLEDVAQIDEHEKKYLERTMTVVDQYPEYAIQDLWNATVHNLRRRVENYSIDLFFSMVEGVEKHFDRDGETLSARWNGIKDETLIVGAKKMGIIDSKCEMFLKYVLWSRNHCSAAHDADQLVTSGEVKGYAIQLRDNLFCLDFPESIRAFRELFARLKEKPLGEDEVAIRKQIEKCNAKDASQLLGFVTNTLENGEEPAYSNVLCLFPTIWNKANDVKKRDFASRIQDSMTDAAMGGDGERDGNASTRLLSALISVHGLDYAPASLSASVFRNKLTVLAEAKNTMYGWRLEEAAAKDIIDLGSRVPAEVCPLFIITYLKVCFGNRWGRSRACETLKPLMDTISIAKLCEILRTINLMTLPDLCDDTPKKFAVSWFEELLSKPMEAVQTETIKRCCKKLTATVL